MSVPVEVSPLIMQDPAVRFGGATGVDHRKACEDVKITPTTGAITWKGFGGSSITAQASPTWAVSITYVQDWESEASFSRYLFDNQGKDVELEVQPTATSATFRVTVTIPPGGIGGKVDTAAVDTVTLGVKGKPTLVPPATGATTGS